MCSSLNTLPFSTDQLTRQPVVRTAGPMCSFLNTLPFSTDQLYTRQPVVLYSSSNDSYQLVHGTGDLFFWSPVKHRKELLQQFSHSFVKQMYCKIVLHVLDKAKPSITYYNNLPLKPNPCACTFMCMFFFDRLIDLWLLIFNFTFIAGLPLFPSQQA